MAEHASVHDWIDLIEKGVKRIHELSDGACAGQTNRMYAVEEIGEECLTLIAYIEAIRMVIGSEKGDERNR